MVKNTKGGSGHKSQARKNTSSSSKIRFAENEGELYAFVSTMLGDGRCKIITIHDNRQKELSCIIRGKFRGRNKSQNFVTPSSLVLVGLRDWASDCDLCDLLEVYNEDAVRTLRSTPKTNILELDAMLAAKMGSQTKATVAEDIEFTNNASNDVDIIINQRIMPPISEDEEYIDIEDI